ncbi:c-type cytochrome [Tropicimonas marinistellae]|uniref:c-type cytochrome n=1 Tax=Tropicimonas marinistellae TaxID=1739787 RepID=UPI000A482726
MTHRLNLRARGLILGGVLVAAVSAWLILGNGTKSLGQAASADGVAGAALYQEHCASCHGKELEGQPNWRVADENGVLPAPPHDETGHTWHHGDMLLFTYTRLGGAETLARQGLEFQSNMPGFGEILSDQEIWNILAFIKSTWPEHVQDIQAERTQAEQSQKP